MMSPLWVGRRAALPMICVKCKVYSKPVGEGENESTMELGAIVSVIATSEQLSPLHVASLIGFDELGHA